MEGRNNAHLPERQNLKNKDACLVVPEAYFLVSIPQCVTTCIHISPVFVFYRQKHFWESAIQGHLQEKNTIASASLGTFCVPVIETLSQRTSWVHIRDHSHLFLINASSTSTIRQILYPLSVTSFRIPLHLYTSMERIMWGGREGNLWCFNKPGCQFMLQVQ